MHHRRPRTRALRNEKRHTRGSTQKAGLAAARALTAAYKLTIRLYRLGDLLDALEILGRLGII